MYIEKLPSDNFRITEMRNGKRIRIVVDHEPGKKEAKELIEKKLNSYSNSTPFKTAAESYIKSKQNVLSPATIRGYYSLLNNMSDDFKNKPLDRITLPVLQIYINDRIKYSYRDMKHSLQLLLDPMFVHLELYL